MSTRHRSPSPPLMATIGLSLGLLGASAAAVATPAQAAPYSLVNLAAPAAYTSGYSMGVSLNNRGDVVGHINSASFPVAATWLGAGAAAVRATGVVSAMPGGRNAITAINDSGVMVGGYDGPSGPVAMVNRGSGWVQLPWPDTRYTCCGQVDDLNNAGVAVGSWYPVGLSSPTRFTPTAAGGTVADSIGGGQGGAVAINNGGQMAGTVLAGGNSGPAHATLWQADGSRSFLGVLNSTYDTSRAVDLNDGGTVVGWSANDANRRQGFVWSQGSLVAIPALPGAPATSNALWVSSPKAINHAGTVVGNAQAADGSNHGFVMVAGGAPIDLNGLVSGADAFFSLPDVAPNHGFTIVDALDINDQGQILALATWRRVAASGALSQVTQTFLLNPVVSAVPEPGSWALMAGGGLLLLGAGAGRRRRAISR